MRSKLLLLSGVSVAALACTTNPTKQNASSAAPHASTVANASASAVTSGPAFAVVHATDGGAADQAEDELAGYLASTAASGPRDTTAGWDETWIEVLCEKGYVATAEAFVRKKVPSETGSWLRADGLAIVAAAHAARGNVDAARASLRDARAARALVRDDGSRTTESILLGAGALALLIRQWRAEKLLGDSAADKTWSEIEATLVAPKLHFPVHLFRAWLAAGEIDRAVDAAKRDDAWGSLPESELSLLAGRVDGTALTKALDKLPPLDGPRLHQVRMSSMNGAIARHDDRTVEQAVFDDLGKLTRFDTQYLLQSGVDGYLRVGDFVHADALVERWRAHERIFRPADFAATVARVRGVSAAASLYAHDPAVPSLPRAIMEWLLDATDGARAPALPSLGRVAEDDASLAALIAELRAYKPSYPRRGGWIDPVSRAQILARVLETRRGEKGFADLEARARTLPAPWDELAAVAWGAAEAGDLDAAERLLVEVVAADRRNATDPYSGGNRRWEVGRLARAHAERGNVASLVRTLRLDVHVVGVAPNAVTYGLAGLAAK